ncbi:MAG: sialate O-acetylesterase [Planctomycetota bacterium]
MKTITLPFLAAAIGFAGSSHAAQAGRSPVKVFVLAGQSNMEGQGVADLEGEDYNQGKGTLAHLMRDPARATLFRHLKDAEGRWTVREDVWVRYRREHAPLLRGPLTMGFSVYGDQHHFGPELQFGHVLGDFLENQVLLVKTAWGGKSLYRDFRPPSSGGQVGPYYTKMIEEIREALKNVKADFPDHDGGGCELAGFVWYQGWNDGCEPETAVPEYEKNLVNLIRDVRRELDAPLLPVVVGELTGPWVEAPGEWAALRRAQAAAAAAEVTSHSQGLHGYIGFGDEELPAGGGYSAGMGFYAAVWPLVDRPLANFQVGLPSSWIQPDNSDDRDVPLCPDGTLARRWKERGPTWRSVFQTIEGGLGYWAGNHFRYGPPKFSMNATPQCYDYEIGSPGWSFFYSDEALPDDRLGIAQLSNRVLIPPDGLPFQGSPNGEFLGYTWMALPFTDPTPGDPPTGEQSWTCFLSAANFKGPIAYYIPETWSKIAKLFAYPFLHGRGLDARPGIMGGGAMEINTVPRLEAKDSKGTVYSKLPKLKFPVDAEGRAFLVEDVTYYSAAALYDAFKAWRDGGPVPSGRFDEKGAWKPKLKTSTPRYNQAGERLAGVERAFDTRVFEGNVWGFEWFSDDLGPAGVFPQYFKQVGGERVAVAAAEVPAETGLHAREFQLAAPGRPYTSPRSGAWARPGPVRGPFEVRLADGSAVAYSWYRFVDQPSFQQYNWSEEKKAKLQALVEKLHAAWPIDREYMPPPTRGKLVALDPALIVTPPQGLEAGYVPIVIRQEKAP